MLYWALVALLWLVTRVYFRRVEVVGLEHVPHEGPVIFVGNHPNSLVDPVLIITNCGRRVSFAAKDVLFQNPLLKVIFAVLGCVPIRRRKDHGGGQVDNSAAFEQLFEVLRADGAFGIFPEGISHMSAELAPLKTGAARIALGAVAEGMTITIVPCGLCYRRRTRLRSRVLVQFGRPLVVDESRLEAYRADERQAARALTDELDVLLRGLTINASDFETLRVLDGVRRLYRPKGAELSLAEQAEITRRFLEHYERLKDAPDIRAYYDEVSEYLYKLDALGLTDHDLLRPLLRRSWAWRVVRHFVFLFVTLPLALPGALIHMPVLILAIIAGTTGVHLTRRKDVASATKMATATGLVLLTYALIEVLIFWLVPFPDNFWVGGLTLVGLTASGWALIRVLERQSVLRKSFSVLTALFHLKEEMVKLRATRDRLRAEVLDLVDAHYAEERIIPVEEQRG